jgi:hypothetical protein
MTQSIGGGWARRLGLGVEPQSTVPAPDTEALHRREEDVAYPMPLPPLPRAAVARVAPATDAESDAQVQEGLDAFRASLNAAYRAPERPASPGTPFQMSRPYKAQHPAIQANRAAVAKAAARAHLTPADLGLLLSGRGSPASIHALTQALIDDGRMPPDRDGSVLPESRIRAMMFDCGIGIDCAGYVQQAYLRAMSVSASAAGWQARVNEDLSNLAARGFTRIGDVARVRPGDIVVLGPPPAEPGLPGEPGHRAIVYEQHIATDGELAALHLSNAASRAFASTPPIRMFSVDSSWGCNGNPQFGGVRRESWWYCESTRQWGWFEQGEEATRSFRTASTPMAHPFDGPFGIFRGRTR